MKILGVDPGRDHLAFCIYDAESKSVDFWKLVSMTGVTPHELIGALASIPGGSTAYDVAVVERQPPRNPTMCKIEHWLQMYFALQNTPCHLLHAKSKLASVMEPGKIPKSYAARKKAAIESVSKLGHAFPQEFSKKDDLADAFLLAYAWNKNGLKRNTRAKRQIDNASLAGDHPQDQGDDQPGVREGSSSAFDGEAAVESDA